jgi:hypothetical protein
VVERNLRIVNVGGDGYDTSPSPGASRILGSPGEPDRTMALTHTDRRRLLLATALTVVALPALWWANQSGSAAPNVATAGLAVDDGAADDDGVAGDAAPADADAVDTPAADDPDAAGSEAPVFLDGPAGQVGAGLSEIAVPAAPGVASISTTATFRSDLPTTATCVFPGLTTGERVTILNLDNGRTAKCIGVIGGSGGPDMLVMHTELFATIADLTDAPIPVEIRR